MQMTEIGPIPKLVRWVILGLLILAVMVSSGLLINYTVVQPDKELAIVSLGAVQGALTGLVVVAMVLFSFRMKQTNDIQRIIDSFFIDDVMTALQGVHIADAPFIPFESPAQFKRVVPGVKYLTEVETDFCRGRDAAGFLLRHAGSAPFEMYLKVNIKHIAIKYFFDPALFSAADDEAAFRRAFEQTLTGAESVGYSHKLLRRYHATKGAEVLELSLYFKVEADMLANPAERLFLRSDFSTMTASMLHTLNGVRAAAGVR